MLFTMQSTERHLVSDFDQPVMRSVLADLSLETMAATALAFNVAQFYELGKTDPQKAGLARLWTAIGKYWICKRSPFVVTALWNAMAVTDCEAAPHESFIPRSPAQ